MQGKQYSYLLILCGILSHRTIRAFADENIKSSSFLGRQKRVISHVLGEDRPVQIDAHPYIVNIKLHNRTFCVGTILSHNVIITAVECAQFERTQYKVFSSSSISDRPTVSHNVMVIKVHYGNHPGRFSDGIALFTVNPPIVYCRFAYKIDLNVGPIFSNMFGTVIGWGYNNRSGTDARGTEWPSYLRSITVPIIAYRDCINKYRQLYPISDKDICTFDPQRSTGHTDIGAPLVINNFLVGIFLRRGPIRALHNSEYPDVFALLQHRDYREWIRDNL